jgi:hypothetical protein
MKKSELDQSMLATVNQHEAAVLAGFANQPISVAEGIKMDAAQGEDIDPVLQQEMTMETPQTLEAEESVLTEPDMTSDLPPEDPKERFEWTIQRMKESFTHCPSREQMLAWRQQHGELFVCDYQGKLFVYRYVKRIEWSQAQKMNNFAEMDQFQREDFFVDKCILYPKMTIEQKANMPAGLVTMLAEQIQMQSGFMNAEYLSNFTMKI